MIGSSGFGIEARMGDLVEWLAIIIITMELSDALRPNSRLDCSSGTSSPFSVIAVLYLCRTYSDRLFTFPFDFWCSSLTAIPEVRQHVNAFVIQSPLMFQSRRCLSFFFLSFALACNFMTSLFANGCRLLLTFFKRILYTRPRHWPMTVSSPPVCDRLRSSRT